MARLAVARHAAGMTADQAVAAGGPYPAETMGQAFDRAWAQIEAER